MLSINSVRLAKALLLTGWGVLMLGAGAASAHGGHDHSHCSTKPLSTDFQIKTSNIIRSMERQRSSPILCDQCIDIETYNVVFQSSEDVSANTVTAAVIVEQMQVLNDRYKGTPFKFTSKKTSFVVNEQYYKNFDEEAEAVGTKHRTGNDFSILNIYWGNHQKGGSFAYFPTTTPEENINADGCFIDLKTVVGGTAECCNLGMTLVHEVGHWLGLDHTFNTISGFENDPCNPGNKNDFVDDTPQQFSSTPFNCPLRRDSCSELPGDDPINNYMDYSQDDCYDNFTPGQIKRMFYIWSIYRETGEICPTGSTKLQIDYITGKSTPTENVNETHWVIESTDGTFAWCAGPACSAGEDFLYYNDGVYMIDICLPDGKGYVFSLIDSAGNGLQADGSVRLSLAGSEIKQFAGDEFTSMITHTFSTKAAAPTPATPAPSPKPTLDLVPVLVTIKINSRLSEDISLEVSDKNLRSVIKIESLSNLTFPVGSTFSNVEYLAAGEAYDLVASFGGDDGVVGGSYIIYYGITADESQILARSDALTNADSERSFVATANTPTQAPTLPPTNSGEAYALTTFYIKFDAFPEEIAFSVMDDTNNKFVMSYAFGDFAAEQSFTSTVRLVVGRTYTVQIEDKNGDGLSEDGVVNGFYAVYYGGAVDESKLIPTNGSNFIDAMDTFKLNAAVDPSLPPVTPAPTAAPGGFATICFSGENMVQVEGTGPIKMKDLAVGDKVLSKNNQYENVYSFGHRQPNVKADFLQMLPSKLELSKDHMVFVESKGAIPASMVVVGDLFLSGGRVEQIRKVTRTGVFTPYTPSGTIVVSGVLSSNYISFQPSNVVTFGNIEMPFTYQWLEHSFQVPHRIWCHWLSQKDILLSNGISNWTDPPFCVAQFVASNEVPSLMLALLFVPLVLMLLIFAGVELLAFTSPLLLGVLVVTIIFTKNRQGARAKIKLV